MLRVLPPDAAGRPSAAALANAARPSSHGGLNGTATFTAVQAGGGDMQPEGTAGTADAAAAGRHKRRELPAEQRERLARARLLQEEHRWGTLRFCSTQACTLLVLWQYFGSTPKSHGVGPQWPLQLSGMSCGCQAQLFHMCRFPPDFLQTSSRQGRW